MIMSSFWKKVGIGAVVGIIFGVLAAFTFAGVTRTINRFFPDNAKTSARIETDKDEEEDRSGSESKAKEDTKESGGEKKTVETTLTKAVDETSTGSGSGDMSVTELVKNNLPAVVSITNTSVTQLRDMWGNGIREYENVSRGSGIIIGQTDEELLIATNNHVVNGASSITVGFVDSEIYDASIKGQDSDLDLAVIGVKVSDVKSSTLDEIKVAVIGDSDDLQVGEQVVAIGNAIGYGQSVTTGIVSALDRDVPDDDEEIGYIQTDAAINPGNSGGALFNMKGELVGINAAKIMSTYVEGMGYAIPMNAANETIENLMNRKSRDKVDEDKAGYLGITGVSVDAQTSTMYGIPEGIYLQEVTEDGPADKAGIHKGDIIKKFDGVSVTSIAELRNKLDYYEAGEEVDLVISRQEDGEYKEKTVTVTLATREDSGVDSIDEKGSGNGEKENNNGSEESNRNNEEEMQDYYNSLPDELKEFFFGFGR